MAALYLPTSGLIFQHRNFYSTRYLEPLLIFGYLLLSIQVSKHITGRYFRYFTAISSILIIVLLFTSMREAEVWSSPRTVIEKSLSHHPDRISLKAYYITTLKQDLQWGRLTSAEIAMLHQLEQEIQTHCGLITGSSPPSILEERDDCMWTWMETLLNPKSRGSEAFQRASIYLEDARSRLLPEKLDQLKLRIAVIEASYGLRSELPIEPKSLIEKSGFESTPDGRTRLIAALCLTGHTNTAVELRNRYLSKHLIDSSYINEIFSAILPNLGSKSEIAQEQFHNLQSCFGISRFSSRAEERQNGSKQQ
jgi:hypothetical protein